MLQFNDIFACIEVDGQELQQYGIDTLPEENTVTCWVASEPGKTFSITWGHNRLNEVHSLTTDITMDGSTHSGGILRPGTTRKTTEGIFTSSTSFRPFMFLRLELTDDDEYLDKASKHMGEIRLDVWRIIITSQPYTKSIYHGIPETGRKIHERAKKALSHCVGYGSEVPTATRTFVSTTRVDPKPVATFVFRYREYNILRANGIIPKPAEQKLAPQVDQNPLQHQDILDLTVEDVIAVKPEENIKSIDAAIRALQRKRVALEASSSGASTSAAVRVGGSQPPAKRIKRESGFTSGDVIDLT